MAITPQFTMPQMDAYIKEEFEKMVKQVINRLVTIGKKFVKDARANGEYNNHTYNLRSSIAFAVLYNGNVVKEDYKQVGNGIEGVQKVKDLINSLVPKYSGGFVLLVVTGEDYAASVESRGKDVLTGSSYDAINELTKYFT